MHLIRKNLDVGRHDREIKGEIETPGIPGIINPTTDTSPSFISLSLFARAPEDTTQEDRTSGA